MKFHYHNDLIGSHSFLSPSNYHWVNYSDDKLIDVFKKKLAVEHGTKMHELAAMCIRLGQKLPKSDKTVCRYVNDAIGFGMTPEQPLIYSLNAFGTADAISFNGKLLRIHDLKTGETPTSMMQLYIYAALFCLEYGYKPGEIEFELRIYQSNDIFIETPSADDIAPIMDKIIRFDKLISEMKEGA